MEPGASRGGPVARRFATCTIGSRERRRAPQTAAVADHGGYGVFSPQPGSRSHTRPIAGVNRQLQGRGASHVPGKGAGIRPDLQVPARTHRAGTVSNAKRLLAFYEIPIPRSGTLISELLPLPQ